jgi:catechol 2,3-dioxygenase-like lactoylglutathione lyase family enzyme
MECPPFELNQVTVPARDLAESVDFYERFGLRRIVHAPETGYARFEIPGGEATFSIHVQDAPLAGPSVWVYFETDAPEAFVARLHEVGIEPREPLEDKPWLWREAHYADPAGNHLVVYQAGENRRNPPWRVDR